MELGNLGTDTGGLLEARLMAFSQGCDDVATEVVPGVLVAFARIAQPDNQRR
jgi:hypothetical protein